MLPASSPHTDLRVFPLPRNPQAPSWPHPTLTTRFLPADRQPWTDKHPDLLTCGRCLQTFPLEAITAFMDHKKVDCQFFKEPSPCQNSGESSGDAVPLSSSRARLPVGAGAELDRRGSEHYFPFLAPHRV